MNDSRIDEAVLAVVEAYWKKVAMIISKTADKLSDELEGNDETYNVIASRIEALVLDGRLEPQGNVKNWGFSEVRIPNKNTTSDSALQVQAQIIGRKSEMKNFFTKLFCGKKVAFLLAENQSLQAEIESLKKEIETLRRRTGSESSTNKMILNPPNSRNPPI